MVRSLFPPTMNLSGETQKRKPVRISDKKFLLEHQKGKCWKCKKSFKRMGVRPILHHKNLNPEDNRISNLVLICPNCHDKIHQKEKKVRKKVTGPLGLPEYRVVKVKTKTKKLKRKKTKKRKKRRERNIFDVELPRIRI